MNRCRIHSCPLSTVYNCTEMIPELTFLQDLFQGATGCANIKCFVWYRPLLQVRRPVIRRWSGRVVIAILIDAIDKAACGIRQGGDVIFLFIVEVGGKGET